MKKKLKGSVPAAPGPVLLIVVGLLLTAVVPGSAGEILENPDPAKGLPVTDLHALHDVHVAELEALSGGMDEPVARLLAQSELAMRHQGLVSGAVEAQIPEPMNSKPGDAMRAWLTSQGHEITADVAGDLVEMDSLPAPMMGAFASLVDAHNAVGLAVKEGDAGGIIAARIAAVRAVAAVEMGFAEDVAFPLSNNCVVFDNPPAYYIEFVGANGPCDTPVSITGAPCHVTDYEFMFDQGGDDRYCNNAGGTGHDLVSSSFTAAMLIDLDGSDKYVGGDYGRTHGINGGARFGYSGFLYDGGGDDSYKAGRMGVNMFSAVNGGAIEGAFALLIDVDGNDRYEGGWDASQGGGSLGGRGLLLDGGGDDVYTGINGGQAHGAANGGGLRGGYGALYSFGDGNDLFNAGSGGVNGGGSECDGVGFLYSEGGDDRFIARHVGVNGGGAGATGFLYSLAGDDEYVAGAIGNGGGGERVCLGTGIPSMGHGSLIDVYGCDRYKNGLGSGSIFTEDETIIPKGTPPSTGMQVDLEAGCLVVDCTGPTGGPEAGLEIVGVRTGQVPAVPGVSPWTGDPGLIVEVTNVRLFGIEVEFDYCYLEGLVVTLTKTADPVFGAPLGQYHNDVVMTSCFDGTDTYTIPWATNSGFQISQGDYDLDLQWWGCDGNVDTITENLIVV